MNITLDDLRACEAKAREADRLREQIVRLLAKAYGTGARMGGIPGVGINDPVGVAAVMVDELRVNWQKTIDEYLTLVMRVEKAILKVVHPDQRSVLRLRYIDGLAWKEVGEQVHYSITQCKRLHGQGLKNLGFIC